MAPRLGGLKACLWIGLALLRAGMKQVLRIDFPALELGQEVGGEDVANDAGHHEVGVLPLKAAVPLVNV